MTTTKITLANLKGGNMHILPISQVKTANLKGGKIKKPRKARKQYHQQPKVLIPSEMEEMSRQQFISKLTDEQRDKLLREELARGQAERSQLSTTQDSLLSEILHNMKKEGSGISGHNNIKNKEKLQHLKDIGVNVNSYHPKTIKMALDGDQSGRLATKHADEYKLLANDIARKPDFSYAILGYQTKLGKMLKSIESGENVLIPQPIKEPQQIYFTGGQKNINTSRIDKQEIVDKIINETYNIGTSTTAVDILTSNKSLFSENEYKKLFNFIQDNSISL